MPANQHRATAVELEAAREWWLQSGNLRTFARIDNAPEHACVGSAIVNQGNGHLYEPEPERTLLGGAQWQWSR
ncbi:MAG: hypothetical protein ABI858_02025 [Pseudoxanthomonas sp.]